MVKKSTKLSNMVETATSQPYKPTKDDEARERRYRAESALSDIERAEKHKKDSDLMRDVKGLAKEKMNNLKKIC